MEERLKNVIMDFVEVFGKKKYKKTFKDNKVCIYDISCETLEDAFYNINVSCETLGVRTFTIEYVKKGSLVKKEEFTDITKMLIRLKEIHVETI